MSSIPNSVLSVSLSVCLHLRQRTTGDFAIQEIDKFLKTFGGQLDANDIADPLESFNTFNQFFYRKLKPSARPIADPTQEHVVVRSLLRTFAC